MSEEAKGYRGRKKYRGERKGDVLPDDVIRAEEGESGCPGLSQEEMCRRLSWWMVAIDRRIRALETVTELQSPDPHDPPQSPPW